MVGLSQFFYLIASVLFIVGIKLMSRVETSGRGNFMSAVGMLIAVATVWISSGGGNFFAIVATLTAGTALGVFAAKKVAMTQMPQLVALFNGLGGLASCLVGLGEVAGFQTSEYLIPEIFYDATSLLHINAFFFDPIVLFATALSVIIGGITFSGSVVAYLKLDGHLRTTPRWATIQFLPELAMILIVFAGIFLFCNETTSCTLFFIFLMSLLLGVLFVIRIGGGDMPVIIALLNSLSGLAASSAGFIISNEALVIAGCLVGASGLILTFAMCRAMNRSIKNVLFGNFGNLSNSKNSAETSLGEPRSISAEDAYCVLEAAHNVVIIPGYGMAVSQAQHAVRELADLLKSNGANVRYAIHPVAGRMPGHMNVLLAEANVPYEELTDIDDINRTMSDVDVALVIGANDVVNPAATEDPNSPIYGMPTIEAHKAKNVFILKRGSGKGFSGLQNALFYKPNAAMIYGDAKETLSAIAAQFK